MSCWAVYSCLFPPWVVVISWILELIVQVYTRNDSRLWERQIITIFLTYVSVLIIDNIAGLKCVCLFLCVCSCHCHRLYDYSIRVCLRDNMQSFGLTSSISIILSPFFNLSLSLYACSSPRNAPPVSEDSAFSYYYINGLLAWML